MGGGGVETASTEVKGGQEGDMNGIRRDFGERETTEVNAKNSSRLEKGKPASMDSWMLD